MFATNVRRLPVISLLASPPGFALIFCLAEVNARPSASAQGTFFGIGRQLLHLHCTGDGESTVMLESRLGGYDRAGYGWSEPAKEPRTAPTIAAELHRLLVFGSVPPPSIHVGHSFGGLALRLVASLHPNDTAGLVLVDSTHEEQFERISLAGVKNTFQPAPAGGRGNPLYHSEQRRGSLRGDVQSFSAGRPGADHPGRAKPAGSNEARAYIGTPPFDTSGTLYSRSSASIREEFRVSRSSI
jgi:pimeloyl-ACP methyl ester carboxylesterase